MPTPSRDLRRLTFAWLLLCFALLLHVIDEAASGFLTIYNPTVEAMRDRYTWFPMPTYTFGGWLTGLLVFCAFLFCLSLVMVRNSPSMRAFAYLFSCLMLLNAIGHTIFTVLGRTVASVTFPRPAPGFWSSPFLFAASVYMLVQLRRTQSRGRTIVGTRSAAGVR